jgi:hypothetical protein
MPLTDLQIRRAKARQKAYKLFDEKALFLLVSTSGKKLWRLKYRFLSNEIALGQYPEVTLAEARDARDAARKVVRNGEDPSAIRVRERREATIRSENTFELIAREWHERQKGKWTTDHAATMLRRIERHLFPQLGPWPVAEIDPPILLDALRKIEHKAQESARGSNEIAHRMLQASGQVFATRSPRGAPGKTPRCICGAP